jgi:hypothetical protein
MTTAHRAVITIGVSQRRAGIWSTPAGVDKTAGRPRVLVRADLGDGLRAEQLDGAPEAEDISPFVAHLVPCHSGYG